MDLDQIAIEILYWKSCIKRRAMIDGERYYRGDHDILRRKRTIIGKDGNIEEVNNLPNNKIVDNQYAKIIDQKVNYLMGKPLTFVTNNSLYEEKLREVFNKRFYRVIRSLGEDILNCGIGYLHIHYDEYGDLIFRRFPSYEILPIWKDAERAILDFVIRVYEVEEYKNLSKITVEKVELYYSDRIEKYIFDGAVLKEDKDDSGQHIYSYIKVDSGDSCRSYNWDKVPIIPFRYNHKEIPLINRVKSLQDAINTTLSDFENNMQEDSRNTILVIKNYDGTNLDEFRHNLATYGAVKVRSVDGAHGGVEAMQVEVNADNYRSILMLLKKALIENAMGYDGKDDKLSGNPNQMNIKSMYSDIDLDANKMETEIQASFEDLLWFVNTHLINTGKCTNIDTSLEVIFNRDILMNEVEAIDNCKNSVGILSNETIIANHPWVSNLHRELDIINKEKQSELDTYGFAESEESIEQVLGE